MAKGPKPVQCRAEYRGAVYFPVGVRCELMVSEGARHSSDHRAPDPGDPAGKIHWTDDVAVYPLEDSVLSAEAVREQVRQYLGEHGVPPIEMQGAFQFERVSPSARDHQVGGDHYAKHKIQPWDIWADHNLGAFEGAIIKYLLRYKDKNGVEDLKKARHTLDRLIELEVERLGQGTGDHGSPRP